MSTNKGGDPMRLNLVISDVIKQTLLKNEVIYLSKNIVVNADNTKKYIGNFYLSGIFNELIILQEEGDKKIAILDDCLMLKKILSNDSSIGFRSLENSLFIRQDNLVYQLSDALELVKVNIPYFPIHKYKDNYILRDKSNIFSLTTTGETFWTYKLCDSETIYGFGINFIDNIVIVPTNNQKLYIIDLDNGVDLYILSNIPTHYLFSKDLMIMVSFAAIASGNNHLNVFDAFSGKIVLEKEYLNLPYDILPMHSSIVGNKLYFVSNRYRPNPKITKEYVFPHIGRLDLKTYTIDWIEKVGDWKKEGQGFESPIIAGNKIYLRDISGKAYVYEM